MATIQNHEITAIIPLFDSEYRIEDRKFKIASEEPEDKSALPQVAPVIKNNARNETYQIWLRNKLSNIWRFFLSLFCRFVENEVIFEIRENPQVIEMPFQDLDRSIAIPNSSHPPNLISEERIPRKIITYIALDVNDSDLLFLFREESRLIIPYLHNSPKEGDVILCRTLHISGNENIREIISNLPKLYKENGLEENPRECNWERDGRNNEQVMICKKTEDGRTVYWKSNHGSSDLVITYKRVLAVKGRI